MPKSRGPGVLRRLAAFLIRGPEAAFILADLDDAMERELARGIPLWRARSRYAVNVFGSAVSVWRTRWRMPKLGVSGLDVKLGARMFVKHPGVTIVGAGDLTDHPRRVERLPQLVAEGHLHELVGQGRLPAFRLFGKRAVGGRDHAGGRYQLRGAAGSQQSRESEDYACEHVRRSSRRRTAAGSARCSWRPATRRRRRWEPTRARRCRRRTPSRSG